MPDSKVIISKEDPDLKTEKSEKSEYLEYLEFQICSDVHLEEHPERSFGDVITPCAPYLILAGDIGDPGTNHFRSFINECSNAFSHVYFVPGNHEYHGHGIKAGSCLLETVLGQFPNVTLLQCGKGYIGPYVIIGATLWTNIPVHLHQAAITNVGDYSKMMDRDFTPSYCSRLNKSHVNWLSNAIREEQVSGNHVIVVTHHPPSMTGTSHHAFKADPLRCCYRNNLDHLVSLPGNIVWVSGHTHYSYSQKRGKAWLISNQVNSRNYERDQVIRIRHDTHDLVIGKYNSSTSSK